jgi:hypothetical protein
MLVASAGNAEGEPIYPRKWNHDFVGMPIINPALQRRLPSQLLKSKT